MLQQYYKALGLESDATVSEVKQAYRSLARYYHPDKNIGGGNVGKFNEVCQAYNLVIEDAYRRSKSLLASELSKLSQCRRSNRGTRSDRRFGWQLPEEYIGTRVTDKI